MFKKGIGYLLFCSFLNVLTALPAKCCAGHMPAGHHKGATVHSYTVIQFLYNMLGDEQATNVGTDFHCSVFTVARRHTTVNNNNQVFYKACRPVSNAPVVATINYTGYNARKFTLPPHYNYLFRLTPF